MKIEYVEKEWSTYYSGLMCPICKTKVGGDEEKECHKCGQKFIIPIRWDADVWGKHTK